MHNPEDRSFVGHPRGLAYIAFTEAWERFSYYGMQTLLVLYMVNRLLHSGHVEHIIGFGPFRRFLEFLYRGHLDIQPLSSAIFGMLSLVAGATIAARTGDKVSIGWLLAFHVLNSAGFANVFPVSLALYARVAPPSLSGTIIGIYYVAFSAANLSVGWIGGFLEKMPATQFWLLHATLAGIAGVTFLLAGRFFGHLLAPGDKASAA